MKVFTLFASRKSIISRRLVCAKEGIAKRTWSILFLSFGNDFGEFILIPFNVLFLRFLESSKKQIILYFFSSFKEIANCAPAEPAP